MIRLASVVVRRFLLIVLMTCSMALSNVAWANLTVNFAQFNNASSATVVGGEDFDVSLSVSSSSNNDRWRSTTIRLFNGSSSYSSCVNTPNFDNGNGWTTFSYTAPNTPGTYSVTLTAHRSSNCSSDSRDDDRTFNNALTVVGPPTVVSINRTNVSPTSAPNVQWTVIFSTNVTGVDTSDFALVNGGLTGNVAITSVGGSGTTYTVTASTGDDFANGTLGLNLVDNDSIRNSSSSSSRLGGTGAGNGNFTGQVYNISKQPRVVSIVRAGINPTSASSVDWRVTFSKKVTGVSPSNFSLTRSGLSGTANVTAAVDEGDGITWLITATTGTVTGTTGTIRLNMQSGSGVTDQSGNQLTGLPVQGETYTIDPNAATECYIDDFDRPNGTPGANWSVGHESGSFGDPRIVSGRLRLTDNSTQASTYATLQRIFPGAGNKIVVEFNHYAYGGSGADGIAMVLSDASKPPIAGAFGGSLGYAPKRTSAGGDTTHAGFSGGWLGVALDEFGNFSNPTEGRSGGPGQRADAVTIRGSGSDFDGYEYLRTTGSLGTGIDTTSSNPGPGYRYRITVDHSDSVHAYTKVERDTSGSGTNYTTLISSFDAKAQPGQATVPTNWSLSFTGSTGGNSNVHEFTHLQVCSVTLERLHHIEIDHPTTSCGAAPVTVKACANSDCSSLYVGKVTANLSNVTSNGTSSWSSGNLLTFFNGQTQVTLSQGSPVNATVNIGGSTATSPPATNGTVCTDGNGNATNCIVNFSSACSFDVVEPGKAPGSPIYTKLVGQPFSLDLRPSDTNGNPSPYNGSVTVSLVDQDASGGGQCGNTTAGITPESASIAFNNESVKTVNFTVNKAQKNVRVRVIAGSGGSALPSCSRDNFAIRPQSFQLTTPTIADCTGPTACGSSYPAGESFNVDATPTPVSTGYAGTPVFDETKVRDHTGANLQSSDMLAGTFGAAAANGVASGTFKYDDVGSIAFLTGAVTDAVFTNVDQVTGTAGNVVHDNEGDCIPGSATNTKTNGKYGCLIGNDETAPKGRFRPHHYAVEASLTAACTPGSPAQSFTYMGQSMQVALSAKALSRNDVVLSRYTPVASGTQFPQLATLAISGVDTDGIDRIVRFAPALPPRVWTEGQYSGSGTYQFSRESTPDGSYENFRLSVSIADPDGVRITQHNSTTVDATQVFSLPTIIRFGRLKLLNANGAPQNTLSIPMRVEYWDKTRGFITNTDDSCTTILSANVKTTPGATLNISNISKGVGSIALNKPTTPGKTSIDICTDLAGDNTPGTICTATTSAGMPWLQGAWGGQNYDDDPTARATFSVFKSGPIIYLRELY